MSRHECLEEYHGPHEADDGYCPFCNRPMRVDAEPIETCAMCGMEVRHPDVGARIEAGAAGTLHFCCIWCLRIYKREVTRAAHEYIEEVSAKLGSM